MSDVKKSGVALIEKQSLEEIKKADNLKALEEIKIKYLGRKRGMITAQLRSLKSLSLSRRRLLGPIVNKLRERIEKALKSRTEEIKKKNNTGADIDVTAPGRRVIRGRLHPLTLIDREVRAIFRRLNFSIVEGTEVESEYYNFDALNIPAGHPARDMWDTFWLWRHKTESKMNALLRTHTSPVQVRFMERNRPPFQIIVPGRVFRFEATDTTHEMNFHQVEGLMVGKDISLANFKYIIEQFLNQLFKRKIETRLRPSYFPFTEPSVEVDIKWRGRWLEVMGAGMVNPAVFKAAGYNARAWQGFAFGVGLERLAMIKYRVPDIRLFHSGDVRFVKQF